ncbi:MAG: restriction endonuclease subunit S [Chryseobacterium sp.]|nr:restriction endonuclease subunit S [Chryseobacterium sp.]
MAPNKLPKDWKIVISSDIMDIRDGTHNTPKYVNENGIPLITSKNLKGNAIDFNKVSFISNDDHLEISKRSKVESGDILFAMIGTIGNPAIIKGDANFSIKNVGLFKKNVSIILPQFFVNFLRSSFFEKQLNERKLLKGTTQRFIPLGNLRKIEIPLPPLETQQAIVSKIEELFSELDQGIVDLKTAQQQLKTYRQSVLKWAFEGKLTNENVNDGELPKGWEMVTIENVANKITDGEHFRPPTQSDGIVFLSAKDVRDNGVSFDEPLYISEETANKALQRCNPQIGDILIVSRGATVGRMCIVNTNRTFCLLGSVILIKVNNKINNLFLNYILKSPIANQKMITVSGATAQQAIYLRDIKKIEIPLPPIKEQYVIVQEIESRLSVADKMEENITQSLQQAEALIQSILKKAFSGQLL